MSDIAREIFLEEQREKEGQVVTPEENRNDEGIDDGIDMLP